MEQVINIPQDKSYYRNMSFLSAFIIYLAGSRAWGLMREGGSLLAINIWSIITLLTVYGFIRMFMMVVSKRPAFRIDKNGITDNISIVKAGLIPWEDIKGCEVKDYAGAEQFILSVSQPKSYIKSLRYVNRQMANQMILDEGSPILVNTKFINYPILELVEIVNNRIKTGRLRIKSK